MKKLCAILLLLITWGTWATAAGHVYSDDDIGRIIYCRPNNFLVIDEIRQTHLLCHTYGKTSKYKVKFADSIPTRFYESSPSLMITQYALQDYTAKRQNGFASMLAKICGDPNGRSEKIALQEAAIRSFDQAMLTIKKSPDYAGYPEDQLYADIAELDSYLPDKQVQAATVAGDWLLATALFHRFREYMLALPNKLNAAELKAVVQEKLSEREKSLLEDFSNYMKLDNTRRKLFRKHYPNAKGLWTMSPPATYAGLWKFYLKSMNAFFTLDELSKVTEPQDWGSAMLDVLLMCEGTPEAAVLEKEFDAEIRKLESSSSR